MICQNNIVFFGTPDFAAKSLAALIENSEPVNLVVCQPDRPKGRGHELSMPAVKRLALQHGIKVVQPISLHDESFIEQINELHPEFIITAAYGKILPEKILQIPRFGCLNVHASLLPKYRGAAPIQHALLNGDKITGITIMQMDEGVDTGDILLQKSIEIDKNDNAATLFERLAALGAATLLQTMKGIRQGNIKPMPQTGKPSYAPMFNKDDGHIDWDKTAIELENFVRAMTPWPSAFTYLGKERIKIIKAFASNGTLPRGYIKLDQKDTLIVGTSSGTLVIEELQPEGKKVMSSKAFLLGRRLQGNVYFT